VSCDDIRSGKSVLITAERFIGNLEFSTLPDGRRYIDTLNSPVVSVLPSRSTDTSLSPGSYLLTATRVVTANSVRALVYKEADFLKWGDRIFRFVKSRAKRRETYPGYKDWFLPEAASWIEATPGHWETAGTYVAD
jgi:hypothetical protein